MSVPGPRTRTKISLSPKIVTSSLPSEILYQLIASDVLSVASLFIGKEYLLSRDVGVFWVSMRMFTCASVAFALRELVSGELKRKKLSIEWSALGMASILLFVQQASLLTALYRLSAIRAIAFTQFMPLLVDALFSQFSARRCLSLILAFCISFVTDSGFSLENIRGLLPGYGALILHGIAYVALEHTQSVISPSLGKNLTTTLCTVGGTLFQLPLYLFRLYLFNVQQVSSVSIVSLSILPILSFTLLYLTPRIRLTLRSVAATSSALHFWISYPVTMITAAFLSLAMFHRVPSWSDIVTVALSFYGLSSPEQPAIGGAPKTQVSRLFRSYLKTVLSNPESRKIFYFFMLNMCFMLVQMLYGVWTNSLGLISDAIHMAFDCMAIGMGLLASVMATWPPNEQFTYGYGRIETLSGFANGIFLILISIFIVFEAIQRILDPPEMNTSQLLLVSSLGLGVNLFGMFAMGGHHHGHSHSHGSHDHSHTNHTNHAHNSSTEIHHHESHGHSHGHSGSITLNTPSPGDELQGEFEYLGTARDSHHHSHGDEHTNHTHGYDHGVNLQATVPRISIAPHTPPSHVRSQSLGFTSPHMHKTLSQPDQLNGPSSSSGRYTRELSIGSLSKQSSPLLLSSPLTPSYEFGHDDHFATHHHAEHVPNLHNHAHVHEHHEGHSHNMRGVFLHVMADTLGSVGVIISTLLIQYYGWTGFDPIASLFIAVLIAASVVPLLIDSSRVLSLDIGHDRESLIKETLDELSRIDGLAFYTYPRFWPKDTQGLIGSIHIHLEQSAANIDPGGPHASINTAWSSVDKVVEHVDSLLRNGIPGLEELTIQVEGVTK